MTTLNSTYFRVIDRMAAAGPAQSPSAQSPSADDNETVVDAVAVVRATVLAFAVIGLAAAVMG